jgi:hypothetical protein
MVASQSVSAAGPPTGDGAGHASATGGALVSGIAVWVASYQVNLWRMKES